VAVSRTTKSGRRTSRGTARRHGIAPFVLVAPAVLGFLAIYVVPAGYSLWISVHGDVVPDGQAYGQLERVFVGLDNYRRALGDPQLLDSLKRLLVYGLITIPVTMVLALVFALMLDVPGVRLRASLRTAIFMPYAVPGVIAALMWGFLYMPELSPANRLAELVGVDDLNLLGAQEIFGALGNVAIWGNVGFNMIVIYTGLRAIPAEIYDAARVDGCNELRLALSVKIPLLAPAIVLTGLFSLIGTLQTYSEPITMQKISQSISSSFFPLMKVYNDAFFDNDLGIAAATSLILAGATLVLSLLLLAPLSRRATDVDR